MPILLSELVNAQLYHIIVDNRPEPQEIEAVLASAQPMLDSSPLPLVHFIVNLKSCVYYPHLGEIYRSLNPFMRQQKLGWFVVYGLEEKMVSFMFGVVANIFKLRVHHVANYDEALDFIQSVDLTLGRWGAELIQEPSLSTKELG